MPPRMPGIPCKLCTPLESSRSIHYLSLGVSLMKHKLETAPPINPIPRAPPIFVNKLDDAPMITPPAKVAFSISYISIFESFLNKMLITMADRQLPLNEIIVLVTIRDLSNCTLLRAELNEGQNIHKNKVPIIANVTEFLLVSMGLVGLIFLLMIKVKVRPK